MGRGNKPAGRGQLGADTWNPFSMSSSDSVSMLRAVMLYRCLRTATHQHQRCDRGDCAARSRARLFLEMASSARLRHRLSRMSACSSRHSPSSTCRQRASGSGAQAGQRRREGGAPPPWLCT